MREWLWTYYMSEAYIFYFGSAYIRIQSTLRCQSDIMPHIAGNAHADRQVSMHTPVLKSYASTLLMPRMQSLVSLLQKSHTYHPYNIKTFEIRARRYSVIYTEANIPTASTSGL